MSTRVPLAVPLPTTSRHRPDWTPTMVPLALTVHCWLAPPLQVQSTTFVPGVVPLPSASRHLPRTCSVPPVPVNCWLAPWLQSQTTNWVPLVVLDPGSSRHRPDAALTREVVVPPAPGVTLRSANCAVW